MSNDLNNAQIEIEVANKAIGEMVATMPGGCNWTVPGYVDASTTLENVQVSLDKAVKYIEAAKNKGANAPISRKKLDYQLQRNAMDGKILANKIGLSETGFSKIRRGEVSPRPATLRAICDALSCTPDDLLEVK